jgi:hypothetical protein
MSSKLSKPFNPSIKPLKSPVHLKLADIRLSRTTPWNALDALHAQHDPPTRGWHDYNIDFRNKVYIMEVFKRNRLQNTPVPDVQPKEEYKIWVVEAFQTVLSMTIASPDQQFVSIDYLYANPMFSSSQLLQCAIHFCKKLFATQLMIRNYNHMWCRPCTKFAQEMMLTHNFPELEATWMDMIQNQASFYEKHGFQFVDQAMLRKAKLIATKHAKIKLSSIVNILNRYQAALKHVVAKPSEWLLDNKPISKERLNRLRQQYNNIAYMIKQINKYHTLAELAQHQPKLAMVIGSSKKYQLSRSFGPFGPVWQFGGYFLVEKFAKYYPTEMCLAL